jgi:biopolymer transport protein TolQ
VNSSPPSAAREQGGIGVDHPFLSTLLRSGPVGQTILAGLLALSIYTWTIIFAKLGAMRSAERSVAEVLARFRESGRGWFSEGMPSGAPGPAAAIAHEGLREFQRQVKLTGPGEALAPECLRQVENAMETETVDRIADLERGHLVLAVAASASPFIGLFGTVWGIMNAFRGMGLEGSAGIAAVAPGVAEALVTTVAGLAVAIPAVVLYNLLNRRVQLITSRLDRFTSEFLRTAHAVSRRGAAPLPRQEPPAPEPSPVFARRSE